MSIVKDDIDKFHNYDIYIPTRTLYMGSKDDEMDVTVTASVTEKIIKNLHILDDTTDGDITIMMNNTGGDFYHGLGIYDAIRSCKNRVIIVVRGHAMSMGALILQAADYRILSENARIMLHYGEDGVDMTHTKNFIKYGEEAKEMCTLMENILLEKIQEKKPKYTQKSLEKFMTFDRFLNPKETIEMGLADKILESRN